MPSQTGFQKGEPFTSSYSPLFLISLAEKEHCLHVNGIIHPPEERSFAVKYITPHSREQYSILWRDVFGIGSSILLRI